MRRSYAAFVRLHEGVLCAILRVEWAEAAEHADADSARIIAREDLARRRFIPTPPSLQPTLLVVIHWPSLSNWSREYRFT
jgi:hypothetical protein